MQKFPKFILIFIFLLLLSSCDLGYQVKDNKVFYVGYSSAEGKTVKEVKGADPKTFKIIRNKYFLQSDFAVDRSHVFIRGEMEKNVHPKKFRKLDGGFYANYEKAYFWGQGLEELKGVNPKKLRIYKISPWAIEGNTVINGAKLVRISDTVKFEPLNETWAKTPKLIIYKDTIIADGDPTSFQPGHQLYEGSDRFRKYNMFHYR